MGRGNMFMPVAMLGFAAVSDTGGLYLRISIERHPVSVV